MIKLVNKDAVKVYERDGAKISYREALPRDLEAIWQRYTKTKRGRTDLDISSGKAEVLRSYVVGWEGVEAADGSPAPYSREFLDALPSDIRNELFNLITTGRSGEPEDAEDENP